MLQLAAQQKAQSAPYGITEPEYVRDKNIKRVADWACSGDFARGVAMLDKNPHRFYRLLGWANAEADAEQIAHEEGLKELKKGQPSPDMARTQDNALRFMGLKK